VQWALRREELCDPGLCPDALDDQGRCDHCPLDKLDVAQASERGPLIRRALDLKAALSLGLQVGLNEIRADEFYTMLVLEQEGDSLRAGRAPGFGEHGE